MGPLPLALLRSDEAVGNVLDASSSLGDIQYEPKGVVIFEIDGFTVHIQKGATTRPGRDLPEPD